MRTIEKTIKKITIEITREELEKFGFDKLWDDIRNVYSSKLYKVGKLLDSKNDQIILITLEKQKKEIKD